MRFQPVHRASNVDASCDVGHTFVRQRVDAAELRRDTTLSLAFIGGIALLLNLRLIALIPKLPLTVFCPHGSVDAVLGFRCAADATGAGTVSADPSVIVDTRAVRTVYSP